MTEEVQNADIESPAEFLDRMSFVMDDRECERMVAERDRAVAKMAWDDAVSAARAICREEECLYTPVSTAGADRG